MFYITGAKISPRDMFWGVTFPDTQLGFLQLRGRWQGGRDATDAPRVVHGHQVCGLLCNAKKTVMVAIQGKHGS